MTGMLEAALAYAARGWPVFPCAPGSKVPAIKGGRGVLDATTNPAQITSWWTAMPDANVAIATGAPGPDVLDVDVKDGDGYAAFGELGRTGLLGPAAAIATTPSGGLHAYYQGTSQRNGSIRKRHIDFRGQGGYVVAAPSTIGAERYLFSEGTGTGPADWGAVRAYLDPPPDPPAFQQPARDQLPPATGRPGDDWATHTSWTQILKQHGWRQVRDLGGGRACWCRPGKTGGFTSATTREDGGLYVFSTSTPFDVEVPYSKFGAYALLEHAGDHAAAARRLRAEGYGDQPQALTPATPRAAGKHAAEAERTALPDYDLGALAAQGISEPKRIAAGMLYPGSVHCLAGAPGGGKTTVTAWWMLTCIRAGGRVMLLDEESGPEQAAEKFLDLGAKPEELSPPYFTYVPFPARTWTPGDLAQLHELIAERKPDIIAWDSAAAFLAMAGQDENSATDVTAFWQRVLVPCARQYGAAVVAIDHISKTGEHGGYGRGSGAKKAASDVQYILETTRPFNRKQDGSLRLTTTPGKDRRGWLSAAYDVSVSVGDTITLRVTDAVDFQNPVRDEMPPARQHLWDALNAIAPEDSPATGDQLVDWIVRHKASKGLKRTTVSTELTKLAMAGLADSIDRGPGRHKLWFVLPADSDHPRSDAVSGTPKTVSKTNDQEPAGQAQCQRQLTRHADASASGPFRGADDDDTADADTPLWPAGTIGAAS